MQPAAIHQFHAGAAVGDGVTNSLLYTRSLLRELGYESEIYTARVPAELSDELRYFRDYRCRPDQWLLHHHSMGHDLDDWLAALTDPRILVYHNITPPSFFPVGSTEAAYAEKGRAQLSHWTEDVAGAIGVSEYNSAELREAGYAPVETIPLLVDLDRMRSAEFTIPATVNDGTPLLLFVGRLVENKRQHLLVEMLWYLHRMLPEQPPQLCLVGDSRRELYRERLRRRIAQLGLEKSVHLVGKVPDRELSGYFRRATLFCCASGHEGFGMPLIEAMAHEVPVLAQDSGNISDTMGTGGLLLNHSDPMMMAAAAKEILTDSKLREQIVAGARENIARFERPRVRAALSGFLDAVTGDNGSMQLAGGGG